MAALRFSVLAIFLLCSCAPSKAPKDVVVENNIEGCFSFRPSELSTHNEPLLLVALIESKATTKDSPCKSALVKYTAFQKKDGDIFNLFSGQFSVLGKEKIVLPIAVQKQLIFPDAPIRWCLSCGES